MRDEKSLFTLLGVFAYGLIVVIALIGITNIINTLSTGMELRSREFATLRSIGMTDKQFAGMVARECIYICKGTCNRCTAWYFNKLSLMCYDEQDG